MKEETTINKYFVFSDPCGGYTALIDSLIKAGFDDLNNDNHILLGLGNYFNHGKETVQMLEFLFMMQQKGKIKLIFGDHDEMLYKFMIGESNGLFNSYKHGLGQTLGNLSGVDYPDVIEFMEAGQPLVVEMILERHPYILEFLESFKDNHIIKIDNYEFIHAGYKQCEPTKKWIVSNCANTEEWLFDFPKDTEYKKNTIYVCGHRYNYKIKEKIKRHEKNSKSKTTNYYHTLSLSHPSFLPSSRVRDPKIHRTLMYKNFILLNACTHHTKFVNIFTVDSNE